MGKFSLRGKDRRTLLKLTDSFIREMKIIFFFWKRQVGLELLGSRDFLVSASPVPGTMYTWHA